MKNGITEVVFVLDKGQSMGGVAREAINCFNVMLAKYREVAGEVVVSTMVFSGQAGFLYERKPIREIRDLAEYDYQIGGKSAFFDALGNAMRRVDTIHENACAEDIPERTVFIIITSGCDNGSSTYSYSTIKQMVDSRQKQGWEFLFAGAYVNAPKSSRDNKQDVIRRSVGRYGKPVVFEIVKRKDKICTCWDDVVVPVKSKNKKL